MYSFPSFPFPPSLPLYTSLFPFLSTSLSPTPDPSFFQPAAAFRRGQPITRLSPRQSRHRRHGNLVASWASGSSSGLDKSTTLAAKGPRHGLPTHTPTPPSNTTTATIASALSLQGPEGSHFRLPQALHRMSTYACRLLPPLICTGSFAMPSDVCCVVRAVLSYMGFVMAPGV